MNFPKLQINSTRAQLGLNIQKPVQQIEQPIASIHIQQPRATQTMQTTRPQLSIDSTEARAAIDLKSVRRRIEDHAADSRQAGLDGTARRAQQGNDLMRIENGGNPIKSQSQASGRQPYTGLAIKFVPSYGSVKVDFQPGSIDIKVEPQQVIINSTINKPIHNYTPGKVTGEMIQHASLQIDWLV